MLIRDFNDCAEFVAGDKTILREFLHPQKADLKLGYSLAHATVLPGKASQPHRLKSSEVYYILSGQGTMHIGDDTASVGANQVIYIPPGARQYIENTGSQNLTFLCIVDPAWLPENEEVM